MKCPERNNSDSSESLRAEEYISIPVEEYEELLKYKRKRENRKNSQLKKKRKK